MPSVRSATSATGEGGGAQQMGTEKCVAMTIRVTGTCHLRVCTYRAGADVAVRRMPCVRWVGWACC